MKLTTMLFILFGTSVTVVHSMILSGANNDNISLLIKAISYLYAFILLQHMDLIWSSEGKKGTSPPRNEKSLTWKSYAPLISESFMHLLIALLTTLTIFFAVLQSPHLLASQYTLALSCGLSVLNWLLLSFIVATGRSYQRRMRES